MINRIAIFLLESSGCDKNVNQGIALLHGFHNWVKLGSAGTDPNKIRTPFLFNLIPKQEIENFCSTFLQYNVSMCHVWFSYVTCRKWSQFEFLHLLNVYVIAPMPIDY